MSIERQFILAEMSRISAIIANLNAIKSHIFYEDQEYSMDFVTKIDEAINLLDLSKQKFVKIVSYDLGMNKIRLEEISGIYGSISTINSLSNIIINYENTNKSNHILSLFELLMECTKLNLNLDRYCPGK